MKSFPTYARFECPEGNSTFSLHQVDVLPTGEGLWVYFEGQNLDEVVESFQKDGMIFEELPTDKPWLWCEAKSKDPDDNQIILYFAGGNRTNPPWRIK